MQMGWEIFAGGLILALVVGYIVRFFQERWRVGKAGNEAERLVQEAQEEATRKAKELEVQAREERAARKEEQEAEFN